MLMAANDGRAQAAAGAPPPDKPGCRPAAITPTGLATDSETRVCSDTSNEASAVFNTHNRHTGQAGTVVNTQVGKGNGTGPDGTLDGANGTPQRKSILSRSWRQIFPRAN